MALSRGGSAAGSASSPSRLSLVVRTTQHPSTPETTGSLKGTAKPLNILVSTAISASARDNQGGIMSSAA